MISVIIATYNNEETISCTIESILNQTYTNFELIIVNDCSTDKTDQIIKSFKDKRIIYLKNRINIGRSRCRNKAIKIAKGKFIAIMDGDDISLPNRFSVQVDYLLNNRNIDLVGSNVIYFHKKKILGCSKSKLRYPNKLNFYLRASEMAHSTWMGKAVLFKKFKYDPRMDKSEDFDFLFRARLFIKCHLLDDHLIFYRVPIKSKIKYKFKQVYLLFLSRLIQINNQKDFYYFPIVLIVLIMSLIIYSFAYKRAYKRFSITTLFNLKYQRLFDKITKNNKSTVINIISSTQGGGAETVIYELDKVYLKKGIDSYVIYFTGNDDYIKKNHFFLGLQARNPISIFYLRRIFKEILNTTNKEIIIHAHLTWPFFFTAIAAIGLKNVRLFFTEHSITNNRRVIPYFYFIDRLFYSKYLSIVCISKGVHEKLAKWVGSKIKRKLKIIYNGSRLFLPYKRTLKNNELPKLISIGRLIPVKNFSTTILAISKLRDEIDTYTIIGEGYERNKLEKLIYDLKLENKVKLIGWKKNIKDYLKKADIQLIPSLNEGFGLVAAEGMSTGLPVVGSNIKGLREVLGHQNPSIILVKQVKSPKEWEKKIYTAIKNLRKLGSNKISKYSQSQVKKFTFKIMANQYLKMYSKID